MGFGLCPLVTSCSGVQSALDPGGQEAEQVAQLFYVMVIGGAAIWIAVVATLIYAARKKQPHSEPGASRVILWCGAILPTLVLCALLSYGMWLMPAIRPWVPPDQAVREVEVTGEQFWWRVRYLDGSGKTLFETANEVRVPVGQPLRFLLKASDVIHSFWIPSLAGKMDMIPGRTNFLTVTADRPGVYRGVCAEFCGTSHALMAFTVRAEPPAEHEAWISARTASTPAAAREGLALFLGHGCGACHAIQGTEARGRIGPDLTAFGERSTVAAGTLSHTAENIARFISYPDEIKAGVQMPHFGMLPKEDIAKIATYLKELK